MDVAGEEECPTATIIPNNYQAGATLNPWLALHARAARSSYPAAANRSSSFATSFELRTANLATPARVVVTGTLLVCLGNHGWHRHTLGIAVDGNEGQVRRSNVLRCVCDVVLHVDLDSNLHGRVKHTVHRGAKDHKIADAHGDQEIDVIDGRRNDVVAGVAVRGHGSRQINPVHQAAAQQRSQWISV